MSYQMYFKVTSHYDNLTEHYQQFYLNFVLSYSHILTGLTISTWFLVFCNQNCVPSAIENSSLFVVGNQEERQKVFFWNN